MEIERSQIRQYTNGEIFTPVGLVREMLEELPKVYFTDATKTICEPSVGEGVFLVEILKNRIAEGLSPTESLQTLYGVDLMEDNILVCKKNLLETAGDTPENRDIVETNIVCADALTYDFSFERKRK
jgi:hypothetical protein|tara:strand:- start:409 stop:789 length:381 start_codon:yes stop_codon:yes gene_type:complete